LKISESKSGTTHARGDIRASKRGTTIVKRTDSENLQQLARIANRNQKVQPSLQFAYLLIFLVVVLYGCLARAEPLPQPKPPGPGGSCPNGYLSSGSFCTPSAGARDAVAKPPNGTCPWGWLGSGDFAAMLAAPQAQNGAGCFTRCYANSRHLFPDQSVLKKFVGNLRLWRIPHVKRFLLVLGSS
jgi:hypothetical protein